MSKVTASCLLVLLAIATLAPAQTPPRMVRFTGVARPVAGPLQPGLATLTSSPSTQTTRPMPPCGPRPRPSSSTPRGRFVAVLGSTQPEGLPLELFAGGEARWLGVSGDGLAPQPRVMLLSVPGRTEGRRRGHGGRQAAVGVRAGGRYDGRWRRRAHRRGPAGAAVGAGRERRGRPACAWEGGFGAAGGAGSRQLHRVVQRRHDTRQLGDVPVGHEHRREHDVPARGFPRGVQCVTGGVLRRLQQRAGRAAGGGPGRRAARRRARPRCRRTTSWAAWRCGATGRRGGRPAAVR